jgi:hypothetical protein
MASPRPSRLLWRSGQLGDVEVVADLQFCLSRLWESNPRPTHYEGARQHLIRPIPATIAARTLAPRAETALVDSSSHHDPHHVGGDPPPVDESDHRVSLAVVAGVRLQGTDAASSGSTGDYVHAAGPTTRLEPHRLTLFRVTNDVTPSPLPLATGCQLSGIADSAANRGPRYPAAAISPAVTIAPARSAPAAPRGSTAAPYQSRRARGCALPG